MLLIVVFCVVAAAGLCGAYKPIRENNVKTEDTIGMNILEELFLYSYGIDHTMEKEKGNQKSLVERYIKEGNKEGGGADQFEQQVNDGYSEITKEDSNVRFVAKKQGETKTNDPKLKLDETTKKEYRFLINLTFDSEGNLTINSIKGREQQNYSPKDYIDVVQEITNNTPRELKNLEILFGIPQQFTTYDWVAEEIKETELCEYNGIVILTALVALGIFLIVSFFFPYRRVKDFVLVNLPLELWIVFGGLLCSATLFIAEYVMRYAIAQKAMEIGTVQISQQTLMWMNFGAWFGIFVGEFFGVQAFKSIFHIGIKKYMKTKTIVGQMYGAGKRTISRVADEVIELQDQNSNYRYLAKVVLINGIIVAALSCLWFVGGLFVILYSIGVYHLLKTRMDKLSRQYQGVMEATNQLATGNLDTVKDEDLGVFNPIKQNLQKIQGGFKNAVEEEVKSQRMKTDLISNVSHDLKTPLTAIISYVELLKEKDLAEEKREQYIEVLDRKTQRLQVLIEDLFEMSKITSGNINLTMEEVDAVSLMKQSIVELEDEFTKAGLELKVKYGAEKMVTKLDSERTFRVFENLLLNATKYSMPNTRVYVEMEENNQQLLVSIKNISAVEMDFTEEEITERFVRGDKSRNTEGSGLGLAIAKSFVELQGGTFAIHLDGDLFKVVMSFPMK